MYNGILRAKIATVLEKSQLSQFSDSIRIFTSAQLCRSRSQKGLVTLKCIIKLLAAVMEFVFGNMKQYAGGTEGLEASMEFR